MRKLLLSTTIVAASALAAAADTHETLFRTEVDNLEVRASDFIGMRVYASETAIETDAYEGVQDGWEDIGEINDVILSRDGAVEAVLVDIGGFLGIGERQVALDMGSIRFVADQATGDVDNDFFVVMNASRAMLEQAPAYGEGMEAEGAMSEEPAAADAATDTAAMPAEDSAASTDTAEAADEEPAATGLASDATAEGGVMRDGFVAAEPDYLTTENLTGAQVYDANDERVGEISELVVSTDGQLQHAVIDVGGFLGIGEKPVALDLEALDILRADGGDEVRVYVSSTREELEAMPRYEG